MAIEFKLSHGDHLVVEDFLSREPDGVQAIMLHAKDIARQNAAAEVAKDAGVQVMLDPATDKLASAGFGLEKFPCYAGSPYDIDTLARVQDARRELVERVLEIQPDAVTRLIAPHFHVADQRTANLNVSLAEMSGVMGDLEVRAVVSLPTSYTVAAADELAREYYRAGVRDVELRFSPLGGDNEGIKKIKTVFAILDRFRDAGHTVLLGQSGNIGQAAVALGHADAYSVGIGIGEKVDHAGVVRRLATPPKPRTDDKSGGGPSSGIYLPGLALTVSRDRGKKLLSNTDIRSKITCRIGSCGASIAGPMEDPRTHYLHSRTAEMSALTSKPARWRPTLETDRLRRALELRSSINEHHLEGDTPLKVRTLHSLIDDIEFEAAANA